MWRNDFYAMPWTSCARYTRVTDYLRRPNDPVTSLTHAELLMIYVAKFSSTPSISGWLFIKYKATVCQVIFSTGNELLSETTTTQLPYAKRRHQASISKRIREAKHLLYTSSVSGYIQSSYSYFKSLAFIARYLFLFMLRLVTCICSG